MFQAVYCFLLKMVKQDTNFLLASKHPIMNMSTYRLLNMVTSMVVT